MAQVQKTDHKQQVKIEKDETLRGSFVSVLILGGFLALTWLIIFILFMMRNGG